MLQTLTVRQRASERSTALQDLHQQLHTIWKEIEVRATFCYG